MEAGLKRLGTARLPSVRLSEVSEVPPGVPHEAIAGALGGVQGGASNRVIPSAAPVA